jgi:hypothetical protein
LLVYKEYVSPIDFIGPYSGGGWHKKTGAGRMAILADLRSLILPTEGSRDLLAASPSPVDELNKSGLGGGSVFLMDGITFGLEVCLDHAMSRLYNFYNAPVPPAGTPKVQVHLIPSWGMSIDQGDRCGVINTPIFNTDGPSGSKSGTLTDPAAKETKPGDKNWGKWTAITTVDTVSFPVLSTAGWSIKVVDPTSKNRDSSSPPLSPPGSFPLVPKTIAAGTYATFFQKKSSGDNIKIFAAVDIPDAKVI